MLGTWSFLSRIGCPFHTDNEQDLSDKDKMFQNSGVAEGQEHPTGKRVKIGEETRRSADLAVSEKLQNGTE